MGTLYIDRKGLTVKLDGNALAFYTTEGRDGVVPINPLKRVVVIGSVTFETAALNRLCDENISTIFLSGRRLRFHGRLQGKLHNNGLLRVRQYEKSSTVSAAGLSHDLVTRKIASQRSLLAEALVGRPDLRFPLTTALGTLDRITVSLTEMSAGPSSVIVQGIRSFLDTLRGYEGSGAAAYFSGYTSLFAPSLYFTKRTKRPPEEPVNAMLSLCYTLLHYETVRAIETIGLDPTIGFYHQFEYGRESLASDLMEPQRPEADRFIWNLFRDRVFTRRDFAFNTERPGCYLKKGSRKRFYPVYEEWARKLRPALTVEVQRLANAVMDYNYTCDWKGENNDE